MEIWKEFTFEAAHLLPNLPDDHKCKRLHGHSFRVRIYVQADLDPKLGWVMDFADIKKAFLPVLKQLDHFYLNDIEGLENPSHTQQSRGGRDVHHRLHVLGRLTNARISTRHV